MQKTFDEDGLSKGIKRLTYVIGRIFYNRFDYLILAHPLDKIGSSVNKLGLSIRQINRAEDISALEAIEGLSHFIPGHIEWLGRVYDTGGIGVVAWHDDKPIGCSWISPQLTDDLMQIEIPITPKEAYIHTHFVSPNYRGRGVGKILAAHCLNFLRNNDYDRGVMIVRKENTPALKADMKIGYRPVGEVTHTRFLFWDSNDYRYWNQTEKNKAWQNFGLTPENEAYFQQDLHSWHPK